MSKSSIKHIVFDLGGVIVNLDPNLTLVEFAEMSDQPVAQIAKYAQREKLFQSYEKGLMDNGAFRDGVRELLDIKVSDESIDHAWNAMLLDVPQERLDWLISLKKSYRVTILSNTNDLHVQQLHKTLHQTYGLQDFSSSVHQVYYSHQIHLRKPDVEIYQYVLDRTPFTASETIFLDDTEANIIGAQRAGLRTILVTDPDQIPTLLYDEGIQY